MKKVFLLLTCIAMLCSLAACGSAAAEPEAPDVESIIGISEEDMDMGSRLAMAFNGIAMNCEDPAAAITALNESGVVDIDCVEETFEPGAYLPGFSEDITGYSAVSGLMPSVGSIPFVCYVFETDDPDALTSQLLEKADPRWNICTEAEDPVIMAADNLVMFTMCPAEDF